MSAFLAFESFRIDMGADVAGTQSTIESAMTGPGWQVVRRGKAPLSILGTATNPGNAFDLGDATVTGTAPWTAGVQMASAFTPATLFLMATGTTQQAPRVFSLDWSDNGTAWTTHQTWNNEVNWTPGEMRKYTITGAPAKTYWRLSVSSANASSQCSIVEIGLEDANANRITTDIFTDFIPPVTETIGNADGQDVLRMEFASTTITQRAVAYSKSQTTQTVGLWHKTAGAVAAAITLGAGAPFQITGSISGNTLTVTSASGVLGIGSPVWIPGNQNIVYIQAFGTGSGGNGTYTISNTLGTITSQTMYSQAVSTCTGATGSAGSTAQQNLRALYDALKASSDPVFQDYVWEYQRPASQNADDTNDYIYGYRKTYAPNVWVLPNANVNGATIGTSCDIVPNHYGPSNPANCSVTIDLVNGFIYYLQVNARGIALGTKTNSAFFGPIHGCYADHAKAIAAMPPVQIGAKCTPIELLVGWDDIAANLGSTGRPSHYWMIPNATAPAPQQLYGNNSAASPYGHSVIRDKFQDLLVPATQTGEISAPLYGSNMFTSTSYYVGNDFQIHRSSMIGEVTNLSSGVYTGAPSSYAHDMIPLLDIQDWYKFCGTATDEALTMVADTAQVTSLAANITASDTTIPLVSAAGLQAAGFVVIESEMIQYASISGNNLQGCTRGKFVSGSNIAHYQGDVVAQGSWFVKINGGALLCGYTQPS